MKMTTPEMNVVRFKENDIIVASSDVLSLSNLGDDVPKNGIVNYKNQTFTLTDQNAVNAVMEALNAAGHDSTTQIRRNPEESIIDVSTLLSRETNNGVRLKAWNGTYLFIDGMFRKQ